MVSTASTMTRKRRTSPTTSFIFRICTRKFPVWDKRMWNVAVADSEQCYIPAGGTISWRAGGLLGERSWVVRTSMGKGLNFVRFEQAYVDFLLRSIVLSLVSCSYIKLYISQYLIPSRPSLAIQTSKTKSQHTITFPQPLSPLHPPSHRTPL